MLSIFDFLKNTTLKEWVFLIIGGVLGYLSNLIFYLKSKNNSNERNLDRLFNLYDQSLKQPNLEIKIQEIKDEIRTKYSLEKIATELVNIRERIDKSPTPENVLKYKLLGDKWSDEYLKTIEPRILTKDGLLFYSNILEFHKTIFPPNFAWAGKMRTRDLIISGSFGTMIPSTSQETVNSTVKPIKHEDVFEKIERYCTRWNTNVERLLKEDSQVKIETIANYHHEFQLIHPFMDGNGRIGRVILEDMTEYLLNKKLRGEYDKENYYSSLKSADTGDIVPLKEFIINQMKK